MARSGSESDEESGSFSIVLGSIFASSHCISTNLLAFLSLFTKFLYPAIFSSYNLESFPGLCPTIMLSLRASAPYFAIISKGSIIVEGSDLLILRPSRVRMRPWRYTVSKGICPVAYVVMRIMRATQKKRMSYPVSITWVGWNVWKSGLFFKISSREREKSSARDASVSVLQVQRAELNHVSSVSASCAQPFSFGGFTSTNVSSPLYHTGTRCPHQIWREMHQSCRWSIQWKYVFSNRSGMILISPSRTTCWRISRRLIVLPLYLTTFLFTSMNHWSFG